MQTPFLIRSIRRAEMNPLIIFINPRSGGNQGLKILQEFQFLLNPRQVFDLTQGGPNFGLMIYKKVPNLRILACGGDGTVGWILSVIDQLNIIPAPAVAVLPLGTGNDLARTLGWGGGYTNEPLREILSNIKTSRTILLDRWKMEVEKNSSVEADEDGKHRLPLDVMNNYFSMGVDANIALDFHEAREAQPERFNSRLKNKMFYGQLGGKDLLLRKWKSLSEYIELECDGTNFSQKLRDLKVHAIVFLNITSYGGGTKPWDKSTGTKKPSMEDGYLEVIGLTTYQLPLLQAGGHGTCIAQCRSAKIVTSKTIPMQVDGEACKVTPSIITVTLMNKATLLAQSVGIIQKKQETSNSRIEIAVYYLTEKILEETSNDMHLLMKSAICLSKFELNYSCTLENLRDEINAFLVNAKEVAISNNWLFLDSFTDIGNLIRIDVEEEKLHYVVDVALDNLFILECDHERGSVSQINELNIDNSEDVLDSDTPNQNCENEIMGENIGDRFHDDKEYYTLTKHYAENNSTLHVDRRSVAERLLLISDNLNIIPRYPLVCLRKFPDEDFIE